MHAAVAGEFAGVQLRADVVELLLTETRTRRSALCAGLL
jgi:hypothetical protein